MSPGPKAQSCLRISTPHPPSPCPPRYPKSETRSRFPIHQAFIKAKNPAIVPNQASSRQTMKKLTTTITSANGAASYQPRATPWVHTVTLPAALKGRPIPPIKAENPCNQGKSCFIKANPKFPIAPGPPAPELPHLRPSAFICGQTPLSHFWRLSRLPLPAAVRQNLCAFALKPQQSCLIKPHQGIP